MNLYTIGRRYVKALIHLFSREAVPLAYIQQAAFGAYRDYCCPSEDHHQRQTQRSAPSPRAFGPNVTQEPVHALDIIGIDTFSRCPLSIELVVNTELFFGKRAGTVQA